MFELIMQGTFVDSILGLMSAIVIAFGTISVFAIFWAKKAKAIALARGNTKVAETIDKVIGVLESGQKVADATANQETKLKQFGEILYQFMGPEADKIRDKYQVKLEELTKDVKETTTIASDRQAKMEELYALYEEIQGGIVKPQ